MLAQKTESMGRWRKYAYGGIACVAGMKDSINNVIFYQWASTTPTLYRMYGCHPTTEEVAKKTILITDYTLRFTKLRVIIIIARKYGRWFWQFFRKLKRTTSIREMENGDICMKPRFLLKQGFMYNKVKSKPYKDICIFLVAHKLKWKGIEPEVHNPYIPISYFVWNTNSSLVNQPNY